MRGGEKGRKSEEFLGLEWARIRIFGEYQAKGKSLNQACQLFGKFKVKSQTLTHKFLIDLEHQIDMDLCMFMAENLSPNWGGNSRLNWQPRGEWKKCGIQAKKTIPKPQR